MIVSLIIASCTHRASKESNQGIITYNITYAENISDKGLSAFLPEEMTTTFKDEKFKVQLNGEFNLYNLKYIARSGGDTCFTLLKILDKKLYYPHDKGENLFLFYKHDHPRITYYKDSLKVIAGYNCSMGKATFNNKNISDIRFYYTNKINFKSTNVNTPFKDVPGMLLEFNIDYQDLNFMFKAKSVKLKVIGDDEFIIPKNYRLVDTNEINEIVSSLIQL